MLLHTGSLGSPGDPVLEIALAHALVRRAGAGDFDEALRVYRPASPTVVFGRRDTRLPGFPVAVAVTREAGFVPVVRATGGRAVAYTDQALVLDHVRHEAEPVGRHDARFAGFGERFVEVFTALGVDARVGEVPGEYCPGAFSVNARGVSKLVGTAQRVVRGGWLFSSLVVTGDVTRTRPVLAEVYAALEQEFDPASVGSLGDEVPGLDLAALERDLVAAFAAGVPASPLDPTTLDLARELAPDHAVG